MKIRSDTRDQVPPLKEVAGGSAGGGHHSGSSAPARRSHVFRELESRHLPLDFAVSCSASREAEGGNCRLEVPYS